jgi:hypothetical protein
MHEYAEPDRWGRTFRTCTACFYRARRDDRYTIIDNACPACNGGTLVLESDLPACFWGVMWLCFIVRIVMTGWHAELMQDDARLRFSLMELD